MYIEESCTDTNLSLELMIVIFLMTRRGNIVSNQSFGSFCRSKENQRRKGPSENLRSVFCSFKLEANHCFQPERKSSEI